MSSALIVVGMLNSYEHEDAERLTERTKDVRLTASGGIRLRES